MAGLNPDDEIFRYEPGSAGLKELTPALAAGWRDILADPARRDEVAKLLGVPATELSKVTAPPIDIESHRGGFTGAEFIILIGTWVGSEVVLGAVKDLAKEELKRRLKQLWSGVLEPALRDHLKDGRLGLGPRIEDKT